VHIELTYIYNVQVYLVTVADILVNCHVSTTHQKSYNHCMDMLCPTDNQSINQSIYHHELMVACYSIAGAMRLLLLHWP